MQSRCRPIGDGAECRLEHSHASRQNGTVQTFQREGGASIGRSGGGGKFNYNRLPAPPRAFNMVGYHREATTD